MDQKFQRNPNVHESMLVGTHPQSNMMNNPLTGEQEPGFQQLPHGCNAMSLDMGANHDNNMSYMMPPIPLDQSQPMYGDGMGIYYTQSPYHMYDNNTPYNGNILPYLQPTMQMMPQYDHYHPMAMQASTPSYTQRTGYHDIMQGRGGPSPMAARLAHRKQKHFLCC